MRGDTEQTRLDLEVHVEAAEGDLRVACSYRRDLYDDWRVRQMLTHYVRLLESVVSDPARAVWRIELLEPSERRRIVESWNTTAHPVLLAGEADAVAP